MFFRNSQLVPHPHPPRPRPRPHRPLHHWVPSKGNTVEGAQGSTESENQQ